MPVSLQEYVLARITTYTGEIRGYSGNVNLLQDLQPPSFRPIASRYH